MRPRLFAAAAAMLAFVLAAHADTYTYTYTGNPFSFAQAPYTTSDRVTGFFILAAPLNANDSTIASPLSFSFSDGVSTLTNDSPNSAGSYFDIVTRNGSIQYWHIDLDTLVPGATTFASSIVTLSQPGPSYDSVGVFVDGQTRQAASFDPGTWAETVNRTPVSATPEPSSFALLGTGLLGVVGVVRRRLA